jgi:DNA invertase Pin-like site-specific DNA recombinase
MYAPGVNLDGYIRVSRVGGREGESFISPKVQREKIQGYAKLHGHRIVKWHEDFDEPGSRDDRPGFQAALARVEAGSTDGIAVAKLNRFARSVVDGRHALARLSAVDGTLVLVEEGLDTSTPMGKAMFTIMLAFAELELDNIRDSWATAQKLAVERGVHVASRTPTGYRRGRDGRLEPVKKDAAAVRDVFRRRAAGASWRELADLLMQRRVRGPYANPQWTTSAVSKLVANPVYTGEARSGRHRKPDAHPAIVSKAEWQAAQGARSASVPRSEEGALLSGILRCGGCRYVLKPDTMNRRNGEKLRHYRCRGEHAAGRCPQPASVLGRVIEPFVEALFLGALGPKGPLARSTRSDRELEQARQVLEAAEAELDEWVTMSVTLLGRDVYLAGLVDRQGRVDEARETLQSALAAAVGPLGDIPDVVHLRALWPELGVAERRRLLTAGLDAIVLFAGRDSIEERTLALFHGEAPADLPARGRRVPLRSFERPLASGIPDPEKLEEGAANRASGRRRHRTRAAA